MIPDRDPRPLIAHVVFRFDVGGLENGVVNLINHLPRDAYRHAVISLTDITDFRRRVSRTDVEFIALEKPPGHAYRFYPRLYRLFREMRPAIVHTRNLAALETVVPAWVAGVPVRIHGEHGRDMLDLHGANRKYQWVRRALPAVRHPLHRIVARPRALPVRGRRRAGGARGADLQRRRCAALPAGRRPGAA